MTVNTGTTINSLPDITRDGYAFLGWFDASEDGSQVTLPFALNHNTTLYAQWQPLSTDNTLPLSWPTPSMEVTLWFGQLDHISQVTSNALNIQGAPGDPVYAIANGIIASIHGNNAGQRSAKGKFCCIRAIHYCR